MGDLSCGEARQIIDAIYGGSGGVSEVQREALGAHVTTCKSCDDYGTDKDRALRVRRVRLANGTPRTVTV